MKIVCGLNKCAGGINAYFLMFYVVCTLEDESSVDSGAFSVILRHGRPQERIVVSCTAPAHLHIHTRMHTNAQDGQLAGWQTNLR